MKFDKIKIAKILFWLALFGSYTLAVLPQDNQPIETPFSDKGNHFIAFATLTLLILYGYRVSYLKASILMLFYGIWIEITQLFLVDRYAELMDIVADVVGILIGLVMFYILKKLMPKSDLSDTLR